jgi:glycosyltransferase involved in cell wall biosynthesis
LISILCSIKKRKFVYILLDIFPEGLIRLGKVSNSNIFIRLWNYAFLASLRRSSRIVVLGRDMKIWLNEILAECSDRIEYIPHWQNDRIKFNFKFSTNEYILKHSLNDQFIVQYSGNMGLWNNMTAIGRAVNRLVGEATFMFVGDGVRKNELINAIDKEKIGKTLFLPFQPSEKLGSLLTACHVAVVSLGNGLEAMAVPCKIYGILASGVPVIAMVPENSEISQIVQEDNCGIVIDPDDSEGLVRAVLEMKTNESARIQMGRNARNAFLNKYTTKIIATRYESLIASLE